jgi:hypothetical protein
MRSMVLGGLRRSLLLGWGRERTGVKELLSELRSGHA